MEATSGNGPEDRIASKYSVALKQFPDEYAQRHIKVEWWDSLMVRMAQVPGLTEVAHGKEPSPVRAYVLTPLDDLPVLPDDHPRYESRLETRARLKAQNDSLMISRYNVWMGLRTGLFASIYNSMESVNPIFAQQIYESCDYRRLGHVGGHFDGELAFKMVYTKL